MSRKERIDALELLGATYVDKKRDMMGALECWKQAMDLRFVSKLLQRYDTERINTAKCNLISIRPDSVPRSC